MFAPAAKLRSRGWDERDVEADRRRTEAIAMKTTESYPLLLEALHEVRAQWRRNKILEGASLAVAGVAVVLAALVAADMDMGDSIDRRPAQRAAVVALVCLVVVAGYAAAFPPEFSTGFLRILAPVGDIPPYTRTRIKSVQPGPTRVPEGQSFTAEVKV